MRVGLIIALMCSAMVVIPSCDKEDSQEEKTNITEQEQDKPNNNPDSPDNGKDGDEDGE